MSGPADTNPPAEQAFNPAEIVKQVTDAATAAATRIADERVKAVTDSTSARMKQAADILSGTPAKDPTEQILAGFVEDPIKFARTISKAAEDNIRRELKKEKQVEDTARAVIDPFIAEYPQLREGKKSALIEKFAEQNEAAGMSYADALKKATEDTIKEFGLTKVSEAQRTQQGFYAGLPGGGGMGGGAPARDEAKTQTDFISGMRSRLSSFRNKK
jgi:hypothetical protein